jgi:hypothetical protein
MVSGFGLHKLSDGTYVRGYPTQVQGRAFVKSVRFLENCSAIVGGSDHGSVYVFDKDTGTVLDKLHHADSGLVQVVTVSTICSHVNTKLKDEKDSPT